MNGQRTLGAYFHDGAMYEEISQQITEISKAFDPPASHSEIIRAVLISALGLHLGDDLPQRFAKRDAVQSAIKAVKAMRSKAEDELLESYEESLSAAILRNPRLRDKLRTLLDE